MITWIKRLWWRWRYGGKFRPIVIPMIRNVVPNTLAADICSVQPMTGDTSNIFKLRVHDHSKWSLPNDRRPLYASDDITVLLIMGYQLGHGHNVCTGFGGRAGQPMTYWFPPGEDPPKCDMGHDWEMNYNKKLLRDWETSYDTKYERVKKTNSVEEKDLSRADDDGFVKRE